MTRSLLLLALGACTTVEDSVADSEDSLFIGGGDLTMLVGSEEQSYVVASWTSDAEGPTRLEFADAEGAVLVTDWQESGNATDVPVVGLWVNGEFTASLVDEAGHILDRETVVTGPGVTALASIAASGTASWRGYLLTALVQAELPVAVVIAPNGKVVWYKELSGNPVSRVGLRNDGLGLWVLQMSGMAGQVDGHLYGYAWDGSLIADIQPQGHEGEGLTHDFIALEDDTVLFLAPDTREYEGVSYMGDALYQMNADGTNEVPLWSAWRDYAPTEEVHDPLMWTHANALRWSEETGTVYLGLRELSLVVELDPASWLPIHVMGGDSPDMQLVGPGSPFQKQHGFELLGTRMVVHDNRDSVQGTRMVVYDLDREARSFTQAWEYVPDPSLYDYVLGDANWVDEDTILANWSTSGLLEELDFDGKLHWSLTLDLGVVMGYTDIVAGVPGTTQVYAD